MRSFKFAVPGKPSGKGRPRHSAGPATRHVYSPDVGSFQARVAAFAAQADPTCFEGAVQVTIRVERRMPTSWSKKRRKAALGCPATGKPDVANVIASVHDGLNGIGYHDDAQVAYTALRRIWSEQDVTMIVVREVGYEQH